MQKEAAPIGQTQRLIVIFAVLLAGIVLIPFVAWPSEALRWQQLAGIYEPPTPTPTVPPVSLEVRVAPGWTLLGLPEPGVGPATASELVAELAARNFGPRQTVRWQDGSWQSHLPGFPVNDFPIEPGRGYFLRSTSGGTWVPGPRPQPTPVPEPVSTTVDILAGWTLVTLPRLHPGDDTAASLIEELAANSVDVTQVVRWQDGQWESHRRGVPANDFPIESGRGYFIMSTNYGTWTPQPRTAPGM